MNLKPLDERDGCRERRDPPPEPQLAEVEGITLYLQPVQDLTVDARISRTQYQYTLEDADAAELARVGAARRSTRSGRCPSCTTSERPAGRRARS